MAKVFTERDVEMNYVPRETYSQLLERIEVLELSESALVSSNACLRDKITSLNSQIIELN